MGLSHSFRPHDTVTPTSLAIFFYFPGCGLEATDLLEWSQGGCFIECRLFGVAGRKPSCNLLLLLPGRPLCGALHVVTNVTCWQPSCTPGLVPWVVHDVLSSACRVS